MMKSKLDEREARARFILGLLLSDICGPESGREAFRLALVYDPALVAARIHLGITYAYTEDYVEMINTFREAIRLDPQASRAAAREEPEEVVMIGRILFPPELPQAAVPNVSSIPPEFVEVGELIEMATVHLAAGRDEKAVRVLERSLRIDPVLPLAVALLTLTYLLSWERIGIKTRGRDESVLRRIDPLLADLLLS